MRSQSLEALVTHGCTEEAAVLSHSDCAGQNCLINGRTLKGQDLVDSQGVRPPTPPLVIALPSYPTFDLHASSRIGFGLPSQSSCCAPALLAVAVQGHMGASLGVCCPLLGYTRSTYTMVHCVTVDLLRLQTLSQKT